MILSLNYSMTSRSFSSRDGPSSPLVTVVVSSPKSSDSMIMTKSLETFFGLRLLLVMIDRLGGVEGCKNV